MSLPNLASLPFTSTCAHIYCGYWHTPAKNVPLFAPACSHDYFVSGWLGLCCCSWAVVSTNLSPYTAKQSGAFMHYKIVFRVLMQCYCRFDLMWFVTMTYHRRPCGGVVIAKICKIITKPYSICSFPFCDMQYTHAISKELISQPCYTVHRIQGVFLGLLWFKLKKKCWFN